MFPVWNVVLEQETANLASDKNTAAHNVKDVETEVVVFCIVSRSLSDATVLCTACRNLTTPPSH